MFNYDDRHIITNAVRSIAVLFLVYILFISNNELEDNSFIIKGNSMSPTYESGEAIYVDYIQGENISKGDIIIFKDVIDKDLLYVKRVVGTSGDLVETKSNDLYINGERIIESSTESNSEYYTYYSKYKLEKGQFFVIGDNHADSRDSRHYGLVEIYNIIGKAKE